MKYLVWKLHYFSYIELQNFLENNLLVIISDSVRQWTAEANRSVWETLL